MVKFKIYLPVSWNFFLFLFFAVPVQFLLITCLALYGFVRQSRSQMYTLCYQVVRNSLENRFSNLASIYVLSRLFGILNGAANCKAYSRFSAMAAHISTSSPNGDVNMHSDPQRTYQVVVAATRDMGIGKDGKLPWNLPSDLKFFKELTTSTVDPKKKNALIMGRKTWESIPLKYQPLPGRLNVVLTRSGNLGIDTAVNVVLCGSIASAMELLTQPPYSQSIEKVFVIGGGQILKEALNAPQCDAIHITEIETSIDCDTFIPPIDFSMFRPWYSSLPLVENNIRFSFVTYVRVRSSATELHTSIGGVKCCSRSNSVKHEVESFRFLPKMIFERHEENSYLSLVQEIISSGTQKNDSTGGDTLTKFGCQVMYIVDCHCHVLSVHAFMYWIFYIILLLLIIYRCGSIFADLFLFLLLR